MAGYTLAALILIYNDTTYTCRLCEKLIEDDQTNFIIIVDNSDDIKYDQNKGLFTSLNSKIHYLKTTNQGYASGNNRGIKYILENLSVNYIWIINNDVIPQTNASHEMIKALKTYDDKAICGSIVYYYSDDGEIKNESIVQCYG